MAEVLRMPLLSDTMKEGIIAAWHKKIGDTVKSDDVIADVETDKATMEVMPYIDGTLLYIGTPQGKGAKVNDIIAIIGKPGEDFQSILDAEKNNTTTVSTTPVSTPTPPPAAVVPVVAPVIPPTPATTPTLEERMKISPLAKKIAEEKGIDVHNLAGSGDNGRIVKRDIDAYTPLSTNASSQMLSNFTGSTQEGYTDTPVTQMRKIIAQRLSDSLFTAPHFYLRTSIIMDNLMEARKKINEISPVKISFNDILIKASAMALRQHPDVNSSWYGDFIRTHQYIHIGAAVAMEGGGLIVPVIKFADQKSLSQIAAEANLLIDKARNKKLQPEEFSGNTFTISNLGMMDIDEFTAIINPPDSCILAVGKIQPTPIVENNALVIRNIMKLTLSCDHRTVDGAVGARFLATLKNYLEQPVSMLV